MENNNYIENLLKQDELVNDYEFANNLFTPRNNIFDSWFGSNKNLIWADFI
jgi:hypothetical protein